jgi:hypothetical protein
MNATGLRLRSVEFNVARGSQAAPGGYLLTAYSKSAPTPVELGTANVQTVVPSWTKVTMELPNGLVSTNGTDSLFLVFYSYSPGANEAVHYANVVVKGNMDCAPSCPVFTGRRRTRKLAMMQARGQGQGQVHSLAAVAEYRSRRDAALGARLMVQHDLRGNMLWTSASPGQV